MGSIGPMIGRGRSWGERCMTGPRVPYPFGQTGRARNFACPPHPCCHQRGHEASLHMVAGSSAFRMSGEAPAFPLRGWTSLGLSAPPTELAGTIRKRSFRPHCSRGRIDIQKAPTGRVEWVLEFRRLRTRLRSPSGSNALPAPTGGVVAKAPQPPATWAVIPFGMQSSQDGYKDQSVARVYLIPTRWGAICS